MFTINLKEKLLSENQNLEFLQRDLLDKANKILISETKEDQHIKNNIFHNSQNKASAIVHKNETYEKLVSIFGKNLITKFQIKSLCDKYLLRCLPTEYFQSEIGNETIFKIKEFKNLLKEKGYNYFDSNFEIIAPKESFLLQKKQKDPILVYNIHDIYYVIVDKWGDDLSVFRRIKGFYRKYWYIICYISIILSSLIITSAKTISSTIIGVSVMYGIILFAIAGVTDGKPFISLWNSKYK